MYYNHLKFYDNRTILDAQIKIKVKIQKTTYQIFKNSTFTWANAKLCRGGVNPDPKVVVGVVDDLQKKFQPLFSSFCLTKKINKKRYHVQNVQNSQFLVSGR